MPETSAVTRPWQSWKKVLFRFFFIYLAMWMSPWDWLDGDTPVTTYWMKVQDVLVNTANAKLFHIRKVLVPIAGSGDTSYGWAMMDSFLLVAAIGCLVWSLADRKRSNYHRLNYWLCVFTRYYVAMTAFQYGIIKLFALQMPHPGLSVMATPLGDFRPMGLAWMFMGYSAPYQAFGGALECLVGALLLFRRTATTGTLVGTAVFTNILVLNLAYDICVKLYSAHLLLMCLFLLANDYKRVWYFISNKAVKSSRLYQMSYPKKWMRVSRVILKLLFIAITVGYVFFESYKGYVARHNRSKGDPIPFKRGIYDVVTFAVNKDTIPLLSPDTLRWRDVILDNARRGSIRTRDTAFMPFYGRRYFVFASDTNKHIVTFSKMDSVLVRFHYEFVDSNTIILRGKQRNDSLFVVLKPNDHHFPLAENQFNWLTEQAQ